jgi:FixJ family two-component response regulator
MAITPTNTPDAPPAKQGDGPLVCVIDDDLPCRRGLERLLRSSGIAAETYASCEEYLARPLHPGPLCLVLDLRLADEKDGLEVQKTLAPRGEQIVFLTGYGDVPTCARAMKAGAVDFLLKPVDPEAFLAAVRQALGRSSADMLHRRHVHEARNRVALLTPREAEVFELVVTGMLNKQIAAELGAAEKTIKTHRGRVMHKMGCSSVSELIHIACLAGLVKMD